MIRQDMMDVELPVFGPRLPRRAKLKPVPVSVKLSNNNKFNDCMSHLIKCRRDK